MSQGFTGFPADFFAFFRELAADNDRDWFEANKPRFRESVQAPMSDFIAAMAPRLAKVSGHFTADPRPNGGSMFRIYRDVRFARDKAPYKLHAACHFRHSLGKDAHAPGFYMHFAPGEVFFGGGLWVPPSEALAKVRGVIAAKPEAWRKATSGAAFAKVFPEGVAGEQLSRPPRGFDPGHPYIADLRRKSFFAMHRTDEALALSPALPDAVEEAFKAMSPMMKFLCAAIDAPY